MWQRGQVSMNSFSFEAPPSLWLPGHPCLSVFYGSKFSSLVLFLVLCTVHFKRKVAWVWNRTHLCRGIQGHSQRQSSLHFLKIFPFRLFLSPLIETFRQKAVIFSHFEQQSFLYRMQQCNNAQLSLFSMRILSFFSLWKVPHSQAGHKLTVKITLILLTTPFKRWDCLNHAQFLNFLNLPSYLKYWKRDSTFPRETNFFEKISIIPRVLEAVLYKTKIFSTSPNVKKQFASP